MRRARLGDGRATEPPTVYVEGFTGALYLDKSHEIDRYDAAFEAIWGSALNHEETQNLLTKPSTPSNKGAVESEGDGRVAMRDSKDQGNGPALVFASGEWAALGLRRSRCRRHGTARCSCRRHNSFAVMTAKGRRWSTVRDTAISDDRFDDLGAAFERENPVVRGRVGGAEVRLFGLAEAVAYAEGWLAGHRPRPAWV